MELVYLWVEDYKNIHHQGFNFSPRFHCEYNEEKKELIINENDDYIPDFFGKNINITAIVGKNGSGKSTLLFQNVYSQKDVKIFFKNKIIHIVYLDSDNDNSDILINNKTNYSIKSKEIGDSDYTIYFNWDVVKPSYMNWYTYFFGKRNPNILLSLFKTMDKNLLDLNYFNAEIINKIIKFNRDFSFQTFFYKPYNIELNIDTKQKDKLEDSITGKKILQLKTDRERKMKFDNFFNSYYKDNEQDINQLLSEKLLFLKITDIEGRDFFDLSHGERSIFLTNLILFDKLKEKNKDVIIYLDEPDLTLHPEWQKKYINELIKTFSSWEKKIHFIITSHSPFIVSDIPKENIIFLEDGKQVDGLKEKKQTFGANIHTLLSDSFFMEDGLMGEFAKGKIDDVINYLHDRESKIKSDDEAQKLIHIIGEPIVKNQLQRMLDSKRLKKVDEIDAIKKSIESMQKRLDELEK